MLEVEYLQFKRPESWIELERLLPITLLSGHLKMQIELRAPWELGIGPVVVGQAGMPHWTATIKEKIARARENSLSIVEGGF